MASVDWAHVAVTVSRKVATSCIELRFYLAIDPVIAI